MTQTLNYEPTLNYQGAYGNPTQEVMRNDQLSITARGLYAYLATFAGKEKVCFPSIYTIFKEFGIGKNTFYKYINELEEAGIVKRVRRLCKSTMYQLFDQKEDDGSYGTTTQDVMRNTAVSANAKAVYAYLATIAGNDNICYPDLNTIITDLNISKDSFYKYTDELEEAGIVERTRRFGRPTIYKLLDRTSNNDKNSSHDKNESENMDNTISETSNTSISDDLVKAISKVLTTENKQENNNNKNMNITKESKKKDEMNQAELAKNSYIHQESKYIKKNLKELIAKYAVDHNFNFSLKLARKIEKAIFGAKKTATKELLRENVLAQKDLSLENDKSIFDMPLESLNDHIYYVLDRLFYVMMESKTIKNPARYLFTSLKNEFKELIANVKKPKLEVPIFSDDELELINPNNFQLA
ncbi:helix-turn-helix domain-containing protein [Catellicoccus marimammalium]|uniref:Helix-turn-helix domain-containing protein n=1 Tax=Catellicoccus marimammalium M35/04/3 TaxID=1234409 RepID=K8ZKV8_9ENTE|nr:helix-turn-helix domain-containing protein [Catellicoccus marimammalium]EKU27218.1 hypothetical protein C683_0875 [Catellicoccus marimammalium M35/04/3]